MVTMVAAGEAELRWMDCCLWGGKLVVLLVVEYRLQVVEVVVVCGGITMVEVGEAAGSLTGYEL